MTDEARVPVEAMEIALIALDRIASANEIDPVIDPEWASGVAEYALLQIKGELP